MRFTRTSYSPAGFTLLELVLVLLILAILSAIVVPSLGSFARGRNTANGATLIVGLAGYARTQAVSEGRPYRMNFDTNTGQIWLTAQDGGSFVEPPNDYGKHGQLAAGVKMTVDVSPQPAVTASLLPDTVEQAAAVVPPVGQPPADQTTALSVQHGDGTYIDFSPTGRIDPVHVQLTDPQGRVVDVGCLSATEAVHVLTAAELK